MSQTHHQCPSCGAHTEQKLPDGWMRCQRCRGEFNHAVRDAEEAERARLLDLGGKVPELLAAERALIRADVEALSDAWVRGDSVEVSRLLVKLRDGL